MLTYISLKYSYEKLLPQIKQINTIENVWPDQIFFVKKEAFYLIL